MDVTVIWLSYCFVVEEKITLNEEYTRATLKLFKESVE